MKVLMETDFMVLILCVNLAGPWCPDTWSNMAVNVSVKVFLDETYI